MIVYGKNVIKEAIFAKRPLFNLYLDEKFNDDRFLAFLKDREIHYEKVTKEKLNQLTNNQLHQGVVANVKDYETYTLETVLDAQAHQRFLVLDEIQDPHNLGAIMRTAEATQLTAIIMSKKHQVPLNATVAKVSSGAIEHVKVVLVTNLQHAFDKLKQHHVLIVGTDGQAEKTYTDLPHDQSLAVILGNEGVGMRHLVKRHCNLLVKIPMFGKINSLNVSVAAALMMYQMLPR